MKKIVSSISVVLIVIILGFSIYLEPWSDIKISNSLLDGNKDSYSEKLTLIANDLYIDDTEVFSEEMLDRFIENDFKNVRFSFDQNGYPDKVQISVYSNNLSHQLHNQAFCIVANKSSDNPIKYDYSIE